MGTTNIIDVSPQDVGNSDRLLFVQASKEPTRIEVDNFFLHFKGVKCYLVMIVQMAKYNREGEEVFTDVVFHSELETLLLLSDFDLQCDAISQKIKDFYQVEKRLECLKRRMSRAAYCSISSYFCIFLLRDSFLYQSKESCSQYIK